MGVGGWRSLGSCTLVLGVVVVPPKVGILVLSELGVCRGV